MGSKRRQPPEKWLLLSGAGIGALVGLSVSPILELVVTSILAIMAGIIAPMAGIEEIGENADEHDPNNPEHAPRFRKLLGNVNPRPLAFLVAGILLGACLGILVRTNDVLGPSPTFLAWKWNHLDRRIVDQRIFDYLYSQSHPVRSERSAAGLYSTTGNDCGSLIGKKGDSLRDALTALADPNIDILLANCNGNDNCFEAIRKMKCSE